MHNCAEILNLIVQEGLKALGDCLYHIRESIKYVKGYASRIMKFKQCIEKIRDVDPKIALCINVCSYNVEIYFLDDSKYP